MPRVSTATSPTQTKVTACIQAVEAGGRHVLDGDAGQVQADHRHHRTGDHGGMALDPAGAI